MTNPSRQKGTAAETAVTRWLRLNGFAQCERRALSGNSDRGDLLLCPGVIAEIKAVKVHGDWDLHQWQDQTFRETANANASVGLLIVKRPYKCVADWWCWRRRDGYWSCQWLGEAVHQLRAEGWGDPHVDVA